MLPDVCQVSSRKKRSRLMGLRPRRRRMLLRSENNGLFSMTVFAFWRLPCEVAMRLTGPTSEKRSRQTKGLYALLGMQVGWRMKPMVGMFRASDMIMAIDVRVNPKMTRSGRSFLAQ